MEKIFQAIEEAFKHITSIKELEDRIKIKKDSPLALILVEGQPFLVTKDEILKEVEAFLEKKRKDFLKDIEERLKRVEAAIQEKAIIQVNGSKLIIKNQKGEEIILQAWLNPNGHLVSIEFEDNLEVDRRTLAKLAPTLFLTLAANELLLFD